MTTEQKQDPPAKKIRPLLQTIGILITLLASLATLASLWFQVRKDNPCISAITQNMQNLTNLPKVPQLTASYRFGEREVADLWQIKVTLLNAGTKTLIGEGPQKNIIKDALLISVTNGFELLDVQTDSSTFPNEVKQQDATTFSCRFLQWRPDESVTLILYLERKDKCASKPQLFVTERYILDGDITFVDSTTAVPQPRPLLDRVPALVANTVRVFACIVIGLIALLCSIGLILTVRESVNLSTWRRKHMEHFREFVQREFPDEADGILQRPSLAKREVWDKYPGKKLSVRNVMFDGEKQRRSTLIFSLVMILLICALLGAVAGLIVL